MARYFVTYCFCIIFSMLTIQAQDIHFSNFYTNTLNLNPADAGFFTGKYRFCLAYRDQYRTVADPYQTITANFDRRISNRHMNTMLGYGMILNLDQAGDADYKTVQFGIPLAQHIPLAGKSLLFSYGILPTIVYNSIDYSELTFGEQFDGRQYQSDIAINENFDDNHKTYVNISAGIQTTYRISKEQSYTMGMALYNITSPQISFYDDESARLKKRFVLHSSAIITVSDMIDIIPGFKMQLQGKQQEFHFGGMGLIHTENPMLTQIQLGIWYRSKNKDAVIFGLGGRYLGFEIILDYDLNLSTLRTASNGHGAFEITATYIVDDQNKSKRRSAVRCPHNIGY